jgi:repressor LexA
LTAGHIDQGFDFTHDPICAIIARDLQAETCEVGTSAVRGDMNECEKAASISVAVTQCQVMDMLLVRQRMRELGLTQEQVAEHLKIDRTAVSKFLKGTRQLSAREAQALAEMLRLDGIGYPAIRQLPVIGLVTAGGWALAVEDPQYLMPAPAPDLPPQAFGVVITGDSMDKIMPEGSVAIVDPQDLDLVTRGVYVVMNADEESTIKRFMPDPARLEPDSFNPNHKTIYPGREPFRIIGRVIWRAERMR